ncbi:MAG TPA: hypothetical protein VG734_14530 [Lacunisphaera sp.]|nr:hypothetical protein [Lacunisphaera sp.]
MNPGVIKFISIVLGTVGAVWALLDPLGGMDLLRAYVPLKVAIYLCVLLVSIGIGYWITLNEAPRLAGNLEISQMGASRAEFEQLRFLGESRRVIRGIGVSLPSLASENALNLMEALISQRKVAVELIICDPTSAATPVRPDETYPHGKQPAVSAAESIAVFQYFRARLSLRDRAYFTVYLTQHPFGVGLLQSDDKMLWSPVLANKSGATTPYQVCDDESVFGKAINEHFLTLKMKYSKEMPDLPTLTAI